MFQVTGKLADEARARGEHLQGQIDSGGDDDDTSSGGGGDGAGQELRDPLLGGGSGNGEGVAAVEARLAEQEAEIASLQTRLAALEQQQGKRGGGGGRSEEEDSDLLQAQQAQQKQQQQQDALVGRQSAMEQTLTGVVTQLQQLSTSVETVTTKATAAATTAAAAAAAAANAGGNAAGGRALLSGPEPALPSPLHRPGEAIQFSPPGGAGTVAAAAGGGAADRGVAMLDASVEAAGAVSKSPARVLR